jgi:hypothetical protein
VTTARACICPRWIRALFRTQPCWRCGGVTEPLVVRAESVGGSSRNHAGGPGVGALSRDDRPAYCEQIPLPGQPDPRHARLASAALHAYAELHRARLEDDAAALLQAAEDVEQLIARELRLLGLLGAEEAEAA